MIDCWISSVPTPFLGKPDVEGPSDDHQTWQYPYVLCIDRVD